MITRHDGHSGASSEAEMPDHFTSDFGRVAIYDAKEARHDLLVASDFTAAGEPIGVIARHSGVAKLAIDQRIELETFGETQISKRPVSIYRGSGQPAVTLSATDNDPHRLAIDL